MAAPAAQHGDGAGGAGAIACAPRLIARTMAALYLDGGLPAAAAFLERELTDAIEAAAGETVVGQDYKSALQERLQASGRPLPEYRVAAESGPDHRKVFNIEVVVGGEILASATGKAKKEAEQMAARLALEKVGPR